MCRPLLALSHARQESPSVLECHEQPSCRVDHERRALEVAGPIGTVLAALVGADVRPMITPFGSLATMLVLALARREGQEPHTGRMVNLGLWATPAIVIATTLALIVSLH